MTNEQPSSTESPLAKKNEIIQHIAKTLTDRRKARNISIEKAAEATKIRPHLLNALESGNWHDLPGEVYVRGFVTRYAQFLGLQPLDLLNPYFEIMHQHDVVRRDSDSRVQPTDPAKLPWIFGGIGIVALVALIKFLGSHMASSVPVAVPVEKPVVVSSAPVAIEQKVIPPVVSEPVTMQKHKLVVYSSNELWLKATSSSKSFEGTLPASSTWTFVGEGNITLLLGHLQDVNIYYDGRLYPKVQKRVVQFNSDAAVPAANPTAPTPVATAKGQ